MPINLLFHLPFSKMPDPAICLAVVEWWPEVIEILSKPVSIAIVAAGFLGLIVGWLVRGRDASTAAPVVPEETGWEELRWRHEKLVLTERQQVEKQGRLNIFAEALAGFDSAPEMFAALRLFVLAERVREARQKLGTDLSRMSTVRERLGALGANAIGTIGAESIGEKGIFAACRGIAESQVAVLEGVRDELRGIGDNILRLEERVLSGEAELSDPGAGFRKELMEVKGRVLALPPGWSTTGDDADRRIRELLASVTDRQIEAVRDILLVDGAITASLSGSGEQDLVGAINRALAALEGAKAKPDAMKKTEGGEETVRSHDASPDVDDAADAAAVLAEAETAEENKEWEKKVLRPDLGFREPGDFGDRPVRIGKGFHDLTNEAGASVGVAPEEPVEEGEIEKEDRSLVLFCSNNVELWGKDIYRGAHCRARAIKDFPDWAEWISMRRLDTGERVFAPVRTASLYNGQTSDAVGFNGTNEMFYGARHLGIFSDSCPNEVETRFTYGGWGFGHRAHEIAPEVEQLQAAGWEGREIPSDTVFEIVIHAELPELGPQDRLLEVGEVAGGRS